MAKNVYISVKQNLTTVCFCVKCFHFCLKYTIQAIFFLGGGRWVVWFGYFLYKSCLDFD